MTSNVVRHSSFIALEVSAHRTLERARYLSSITCILSPLLQPLIPSSLRLLPLLPLSRAYVHIQPKGLSRRLLRPIKTHITRGKTIAPPAHIPSLCSYLNPNALLCALSVIFRLTAPEALDSSDAPIGQPYFDASWVIATRE